MAPTPSAPAILAHPDFALAAELRTSIEAEQTYTAANLWST